MGILPGIGGLIRAWAALAAWTAIMAAASVSFAADAAVWSGDALKKAQTLAHEIVAPRFPKGRIPKALSVAVGVNGSLVYAEGHGEARPGMPATPETIYRIGSITKQFLAAAMLNALDEERIRTPSGAAATLETSISDVLTDAKALDDNSDDPLTFRKLLTMRADIGNFTRKPPVELDPWGSVTAPELRAALLRMKRSATDSGFAYSNTGYFFLSETLRQSRVDSDYERALGEFVLNRVQLKSTGFMQDERLTSSLAEPAYGRRPAFIEPFWLQGSADLLSSVLDLHSWNAALIDGKVLSANRKAEMFNDAARVDVWTYYGMGWFIRHKDGIDTFFHSGSVPGYTGYNVIYRYPDGIWVSVSLLSNSDGVEDLPQLADDLAEIAIAAR